MSKSLSELQQSPDVGLPERHVDICVSARLVDELAPIQAEFLEVESKIAQLRDEAERRREDGPIRPGRMGERSELPDLEARSKELAEKGDAIRERIKDATATILLRGKTQGEWRTWARSHPARDEEEDPQGAARDQAWAGGAVNIDAVVSDLRVWAAKYNDEDPSDAWADFVASNGVPAQLTIAASHVVAMHEQVVDAGKSLRDWREGRRTGSDSE